MILSERGREASGSPLQAGVSVNGVLSTERAVQGNSIAAGGQATDTDRPTITSVPLTGERFMRGLLAPIDPENVCPLWASGLDGPRRQ